jgi:glyoxylase-like metal-dependent hydrolase (beta-lactamase superfamily II)
MVKRWDVVVIGSPSRNPYWGESVARPVRTPICTCTLITGDGFRLLVDPSLHDRERMLFALERRSGLGPEGVDLVFVTHPHGDHVAGLECFPDSTWIGAEECAAALNRSGRFSRSVADAARHLPPEVELVPSPGHCSGHHSLRFDCEGKSVVVAGDATLTRDFCRDGLSSFGTPTEQERETVRALTQMADAIVPGHGNWFAVDWD